jgi:CIC family chloride channel protein
MSDDEPDDEGQASQASFLWLAILSPIVGAYAGFVGAVFRLSLDWADHARGALMAAAQGHGIGGVAAAAAACGIAAALAALLVRRYSPHAGGSGIPHVEAVLQGLLPQASILLLPVKFVGGVLAIGAGLALGREGPSVQMGATISHLVGKVFGCTSADCRALLAAGAGAGLATAFNAPIAGAVFVLEELVGRFDARIAIAALGASATAISVSYLLLPDVPVFAIAALPWPPPEAMPLCILLGGIAGLLGIVYNRVLLATIGLLGHVPPEIRAGAIGVSIGAIAWLAPNLVGGGESIAVQALSGIGTLDVILVIFLVRAAMSVVSYAAGTPGGIFAPLLALGAHLGLAFGLVCVLLLPGLGFDPRSFAVVGTAALFTAVVRAPVTGIVLITEMTASTAMLLPMLGACFTAMLVPTMLRDPPIYDSLRELTIARGRAAAPDRTGSARRTPPGKVSERPPVSLFGFLRPRR